MPKQVVSDYEGALEHLQTFLDQDRAANFVPELDDYGQATGKSYDPRMGRQKDQPDPQRLQAYLAYIRQKNSRYTPQTGEQIPGFDHRESSGGFDIENILKSAYMNSLTGSIEKFIDKDDVANAFGLFDPGSVARWKPNMAEEAASGVASMFMPADFGALVAGGGIGKAAAGGLKLAGASARIMKTGTTLATYDGLRGFFGGEEGRGLAQSVASTSMGVGTGFLVGALLGGTGTTVSKYVKGAAGKVAEIPAEIVTLGTISPLLEARSPTARDYGHAAGFIVGLRMFGLRGLIKGAKQAQSEKQFNKDVTTEIRKMQDKVEAGETPQDAFLDVTDKTFKANSRRWGVKMFDKIETAKDGERIGTLGDFIKGKGARFAYTRNVGEEILDIPIVVVDKLPKGAPPNSTGFYVADASGKPTIHLNKAYPREAGITILHEAVHAKEVLRGITSKRREKQAEAFSEGMLRRTEKRQGEMARSQQRRAKIAAAAKKKGQVKQPWEMTREEYVNEQVRRSDEKHTDPGFSVEYRSKTRRGTKNKAETDWVESNEKAFIEGKTVTEKPIWAKTLREYNTEQLYESAKIDKGVRAEHIESVQQAISEGKPVPPEVLKDYPGLKPTPAKQPWEMTREEFEGSTTFGKLNKEVLAYKESGAIASEAVGKGDIKSAAFRDTETGKIYETGNIHDLNKLPKDVVVAFGEGQAVGKASLESGFINKSGKFFTRSEIAGKKEIVDVPHGQGHKRIVQRALSEGKPVPPEVLKDYPELTKKTLPVTAQNRVRRKKINKALEEKGVTEVSAKDATPQLKRYTEGKETPDSYVVIGKTDAKVQIGVYGDKWKVLSVSQKGDRAALLAKAEALAKKRGVTLESPQKRTRVVAAVKPTKPKVEKEAVGEKTRAELNLAVANKTYKKWQRYAEELAAEIYKAKKSKGRHVFDLEKYEAPQGKTSSVADAGGWLDVIVQDKLPKLAEQANKFEKAATPTDKKAAFRQSMERRRLTKPPTPGKALERRHEERGIAKNVKSLFASLKSQPEGAGVDAAKKSMIEHDRGIRDSEFMHRKMKAIVDKAVPDKDRQMLMVHAYEHKMQGKYWDALTPLEKQVLREMASQKADLDTFIKDNDLLEMLESKEFNHIFHQWINPKTGKAYAGKYGKFSKALPQAKQRTIETYEAGIEKGLKPATTNIGELIGLELEAATRAHQTRSMVKTLNKISAEGATDLKMIESWDKVTKDGLSDSYERFSHPSLDKPIWIKDAKGKKMLIKGHIGIRKELFPFVDAYMRSSSYGKLDQLNFATKSLKLGLSLFHINSLALQEIANFRLPYKNIPRGLRLIKEMGPELQILHREGLELFKGYEDVGYRNKFFEGESVVAKYGNAATKPLELMRSFIFDVVQPGMKASFAVDKYNKLLPKYLAADKTFAQAAREVVQKADGHFSGEHYKRSLLETNRFMVKSYFSPESRKWWQRVLLSPTWQREHMLVAKNIAKSFMPDLWIKKLGLAELGPIKSEYRKYMLGAVLMVGAVDLFNQMVTKEMDGEALHIWQNPKGKGFHVRAWWNQPDRLVSDKNGRRRRVKGGPGYIKPLKSIYEVAEWGGDPVKKFIYKLSPGVSAIGRQLWPSKYDQEYGGITDMPQRTLDFILDVGTPISAAQAVEGFKGKKTPTATVLPFLGYPTSVARKLTPEERRKYLRSKFRGR